MVDEVDKLKEKLNASNAIIYPHTHQSITWTEGAFDRGELKSYVVPDHMMFVVEQVVKQTMKFRDFCHLEIVIGGMEYLCFPKWGHTRCILVTTV